MDLLSFKFSRKAPKDACFCATKYVTTVQDRVFWSQWKGDKGLSNTI